MLFISAMATLSENMFLSLWIIFHILVDNNALEWFLNGHFAISMPFSKIDGILIHP